MNCLLARILTIKARLRTTRRLFGLNIFFHLRDFIPILFLCCTLLHQNGLDLNYD